VSASKNYQEKEDLMSSMQKALLPLAIAGLCWIGAVAQTGNYGSNDANANTTRHTEKASKTGEHAFLREAYQSDLAEVQLGQLAQQKASNQQVKQFAQRMIDDHNKNLDQVKQVAQQEGVTLPEKPAAKDEATKNRLEKLSGKEFDHAYMRDMVKDHTTDVAKFKDEAKENVAPAVKNYVDQTLPTLESHLQQARSVEPQTAQGTHHKAGTTTGS
jgi:putative membrane protein